MIAETRRKRNISRFAPRSARAVHLALLDLTILAKMRILCCPAEKDRRNPDWKVKDKE